MHRTSVKLIIGKARGTIIGCFCSINDIYRTPIDCIWGVKSTDEVAFFIYLVPVYSWSFEAGGEIGEFSIVVEEGEKVASYGSNIAHIEASGWETGEVSSTIKTAEEIISSHFSDVTCVETSDW